jgi:hypothetical protein
MAMMFEEREAAEVAKATKKERDRCSRTPHRKVGGCRAMGEGEEEETLPDMGTGKRCTSRPAFNSIRLALMSTNTRELIYCVSGDEKWGVGGSSC